MSRRFAPHDTAHLVELMGGNVRSILESFLYRSSGGTLGRRHL